jgi:hypothetical protein
MTVQLTFFGLSDPVPSSPSETEEHMDLCVQIGVICDSPPTRDTRFPTLVGSNEHNKKERKHWSPDHRKSIVATTRAQLLLTIPYNTGTKHYGYWTRCRSAGRWTTSTRLTWIGFDQEATRIRLREEGFESFTDILTLKEKDVCDLAELYSRHTIADGRAIFGLRKIRYLIGLNPLGPTTRGLETYY